MGSSQTIKTSFSRIVFTILLVSILGYGFFATRYIWQQKSLIINTKIENNLMTISGQTTKAREALINGHSVALNSDGTFSDTVSLLPGYNTLTVSTTDIFGKDKTITKQVYHQTTPLTVAQASGTTQE